MTNYKQRFTIQPAADQYMIAAGPWRVFAGTLEQCENCLAAMERHGLMTPQNWSAAAAVTRARFAMRGAEIKCFGPSCPWREC